MLKAQQIKKEEEEYARNIDKHQRNEKERLGFIGHIKQTKSLGILQSSTGAESAFSVITSQFLEKEDLRKLMYLSKSV